MSWAERQRPNEGGEQGARIASRPPARGISRQPRRFWRAVSRGAPYRCLARITSSDLAPIVVLSPLLAVRDPPPCLLHWAVVLTRYGPTIDRCARPGRSHRSSPLPPAPAVDQRRHAAHGPAARASGPGRVLGLLPRQLGPHASRTCAPGTSATSPPGCGSSACMRRGSSPPRTPRRCARRSPGWRCPIRSWSTSTTRSGATTATSAGPPATCSGPTAGCLTTTTARAATTRPSGPSRSCWGSTSRCSSRSGPRTRPGRCWRFRPTTSRGSTQGPTRPAACGRCSTATAR